MIGIDTNVLLRFLVTDDNRMQHEAAAKFMTARTPDDPARISLVVLAETVWVLHKRLRYGQMQIIEAMRLLLSSSDIVFEERDFLAALFHAEGTLQADIADYLIAHSNTRAGCSATMTFDTGAATHVPGMSLLS